MESYVVHKATVLDAPAAVELLRRSISELCVAAHHGAPATLERWLQNKTIPHLERWIADPDNFVAVAALDTELDGIALINVRGKVHLCYVRPGRARAGIGSAMLHRLEAEALRWSLPEIQLTSTINACAFYERHGYTSTGEASVAFGVLMEYPYRKALNAAAV